VLELTTIENIIGEGPEERHDTFLFGINNEVVAVFAPTDRWDKDRGSLFYFNLCSDGVRGIVFILTHRTFAVSKVVESVMCTTKRTRRYH
jgi:hypothetical protein